MKCADLRRQEVSKLKTTKMILIWQVLAIIGFLLAIISYFLPWYYEGNGPGEVSLFREDEVDDGGLLFFIFIVPVFFALLILLPKRLYSDINKLALSIGLSIFEFLWGIIAIILMVFTWGGREASVGVFIYPLGTLLLSISGMGIYSTSMVPKVSILSKNLGLLRPYEWGLLTLNIRNEGSDAAKNISVEPMDKDIEIKPASIDMLHKRKSAAMSVYIMPKFEKSKPADFRIIYEDKKGNKYHIEFSMLINFESKRYMGVTQIGSQRVAGPQMAVSQGNVYEMNNVKPAVNVGKIREMYGIKSEEDIEKEYNWGEFASYRILRRIGSGGFSDVYLVEKGGKNMQ